MSNLIKPNKTHTVLMNHISKIVTFRRNAYSYGYFLSNLTDALMCSLPFTVSVAHQTQCVRPLDL